MSTPLRPIAGLTTPPLDAATGLPVGVGLRPDWEVSPRQLSDAMARGLPSGTVLLDCRRDEEVAFNRLPGAVHIEMNQIEKRADELEADDGSRDHEVIVYCHHGRRSMVVAQALRALGFPRARSLAGGIDAWSMSIDPGVPRY